MIQCSPPPQKKNTFLAKNYVFLSVVVIKLYQKSLPVKTLFILSNGNNFVPLVFIAKISICLFFKVKRQKINLLLP